MLYDNYVNCYAFCSVERMRRSGPEEHPVDSLLPAHYDNSLQHVLFVLDTSNSMGEDFNRLTDILGDLVLFFCKPVRVAAMTFDHEFFVEFCFNCFDNTCSGRLASRNAMKNIDYGFNRTGVRYTHTGGAAQCVCDFMLSSTCGIDPIANHIDVVFITDGRSNDPSRDVCSDILCLRNRFGVNIYTIGINAYEPELECISDEDLNAHQFHRFNFRSFDDFEDTFHELYDVLTTDNVDGPYTCPNGGIGTTTC